jgi:hypothetical protein
MSNLIGRYSDIHIGVPEVSDLQAGMDFRRPEYRREVFLRFYEFHSKYQSHPGAVYYAFPYIFEFYAFTTEQKYWFCYLNGLCQNVLTTWELFSFMPKLPYEAKDRDNYTKFGWDTDRRYVKNQFEKCVESYIKELGGKSQEEYFNEICNTANNLLTEQYRARRNFDKLWAKVIGNFYLFGRLSTFSYLEYLKIAGLPIECSNLFIYDIDGSKSHRNGLCKVLGRDDLDWHDTLNPEFKGYTDGQLIWLESEGERLLQEAKDRGIDASYFTLESTLCNYKSWHRKNRRYPNVYNDMFYDRILKNEAAWGRRNDLFRRIRQECLPKHLRVEDNPGDPGLKPAKQNHYLNTGQVIMMDREWPCFVNDFNNKLNDIQVQPIRTLF